MLAWEMGCFEEDTGSLLGFSMKPDVILQSRLPGSVRLGSSVRK
jgi:hypothetical protein